LPGLRQARCQSAAALCACEDGRLRLIFDWQIVLPGSAPALQISGLCVPRVTSPERKPIVGYRSILLPGGRGWSCLELKRSRTLRPVSPRESAAFAAKNSGRSALSWMSPRDTSSILLNASAVSGSGTIKRLTPDSLLHLSFLLRTYQAALPGP